MTVKKIIYFLLCVAFMPASCKKSASPAGPAGAPVITTANISHITSSTAISAVSISKIDDSFIVSGMVWNTQPHPVVSLSTKITNFNRVTKYTDTLTGLSGGITYYVRAFLTTKDSVYYGNEISFTTVVPPVAIGNSYAGGIIFYVDPSKAHGLVAAPFDQGISVPWDNGNYQNIKTNFVTATAIGTGSANTDAIIQQLGATPPGYAALTCRSLVLNGFKDWFLPSKDELFLVKKNLFDAGFGNFQATAYWSSSTDNVSDFYVWLQNFNNDTPVLTNISLDEGVRAVRAF